MECSVTCQPSLEAAALSFALAEAPASTSFTRVRYESLKLPDEKPLSVVSTLYNAGPYLVFMFCATLQQPIRCSPWLLQKVISEGSSDAGFPWLVHCPSSNADLILLWLRAPFLAPRSGVAAVVAAATVILGCETLGAETFGFETVGTEDLGSETFGSEALGTEALGPESLGIED